VKNKIATYGLFSHLAMHFDDTKQKESLTTL